VTKEELVEGLEREWEALQAAIHGLTEEQMTRPPVSGPWTVKDLLAHIAVWTSRLVTDLYKIDRGVTPDVGLTQAQVDKLNAQFYVEQKDRPLERVLEDLHNVHLALLNRLEAMPEKSLIDPKKHRSLKGQPLTRWVTEDSLEHYREHADEIRLWRQRIDAG